MRFLQKAKPNDEYRASSDLAVTKAIFESQVEQASLQFYDGLLATLFTSWPGASQAPKVFFASITPHFSRAPGRLLISEAVSSSPSSRRSLADRHTYNRNLLGVNFFPFLQAQGDRHRLA